MSTLIYVQHFNKNVNVGSYESWLMSMEFQNSILLYEKLSKTVFHIIFALSFLEQPMIASYATITFVLFEDWLKKRVRDRFNPLAEIVALQEPQMKQNQNSTDRLCNKKNAF